MLDSKTTLNLILANMIAAKIIFWFQRKEDKNYRQLSVNGDMTKMTIKARYLNSLILIVV